MSQSLAVLAGEDFRDPVNFDVTQPAGDAVLREYSDDFTEALGPAFNLRKDIQ